MSDETLDKMTPIDRLKLAVSLIKKLPDDIQLLMEASEDPEVSKQLSELAIQLIRIIPEIQKRMAVEALRRVGII